MKGRGRQLGPPNGAMCVEANARVSAAASEKMRDRSAGTETSQDTILTQLQCLAFSNIADYVVTEDGQIGLAQGAPRDAMRALQSFKHKVRSYDNGANRRVELEVEIKLWDKLNPLKVAGRHTGLFPNEVKMRAPSRRS